MIPPIIITIKNVGIPPSSVPVAMASQSSQSHLSGIYALAWTEMKEEASKKNLDIIFTKSYGSSLSTE